MAFTRKIWKRGDKITAKELNRIEDGIAAGSNSISSDGIIIHTGPSGHNLSITPEEFEALDIWAYEGSGYIPDMTLIVGVGGEYGNYVVLKLTYIDYDQDRLTFSSNSYHAYLKRGAENLGFEFYSDVLITYNCDISYNENNSSWEISFENNVIKSEALTAMCRNKNIEFKATIHVNDYYIIKTILKRSQIDYYDEEFIFTIFISNLLALVDMGAQLPVWCIISTEGQVINVSFTQIDGTPFIPSISEP